MFITISDWELAQDYNMVTYPVRYRSKIELLSSPSIQGHALSLVP